MFLNDSFIKQIGPLAEHEIEMLRTLAHERAFKKNQLILKAGTICSSFYFLLQGAVYQFKPNANDAKTFTHLNIKNDWIVDNKSFTSQQPSDRNIEAFTDCEMIEVPIQALHKLIKYSQTFLGFARVMNQAEDRVTLLQQAETPANKYQLLEQQFPEIIKTFPLKVIASYLKMTPETLSRVRARRQGDL